MYARRTDEHAVTDRIVHEVDPRRFRASPNRRSKGWQEGIESVGDYRQSVEARERRLVPEAIEQFFVQAAPRSDYITTDRRQQPCLSHRQAAPSPTPDRCSAGGAFWTAGAGLRSHRL